MPPKTNILEKEVLVILFNGRQILGKVVKENEKEIEIWSKAYGRQKFEINEIREIKE